MDKQNEIKDVLIKMSKECVAVRVRLLNRIITNIYDFALKPIGIKLNQLNILIVIYLSDEIGYDGLSKKLIMDKSTVSRNIDRMVKKGWLDVSISAEANKKMIRVTKDGKELLQKVYGLWEQGQNKTTEILGVDFTKTLIFAVNNLLKNRKQK